MKRSISLFPLLLCFILPSLISNSSFLQRHSLSDKIRICEDRNPAQPLTSCGQSLISNSDDPRDIVLCPGDAFGDLTETYVKVEDCYLAMYHKTQLIWSSKGSEYWRTSFNGYRALRYNYYCVFSLERDGNLLLYKEDKAFYNSGASYKVAEHEWDSQTNFNPVKTELKLKDQQVQIIQTFEDGAQRLFYADADHQEFVEDLGEPVKIADKYVIRNHQDEDKTILKRNEYIGDLNGIHLIFQANCDLQLLNKNQVLWSFVPPFRHEMSCMLNIAENNQIEISSFLTGNAVGSFDQAYNDKFMQGPYRESILNSDPDLEVVESHITFEENQPIIIQTLKNGSGLIFCGMSGQNSGLNLKRELTQIALKTVTLQNPYEFVDDSDDEDIFTIKRMDYIGDLSGLHLILQQNCSLIFANGETKLWELDSEPRYLDVPLMECSVKLYPYGIMYFKKDLARQLQENQRIFGHNYLVGDVPGFITGVELTLENDQITVNVGRSGLSPDVFYAGPKTNGTFSRLMAQNSLLIDPYEDSDILPQMGYIGDLDGIFTILDKNCNWVLYNKTQVLWESGTFSSPRFYCTLSSTEDREPMIPYIGWYAIGSSDFTSTLKEPVRAELSVNNDGLWLTYTLRDGTVFEYQAVLGTNHFGLVEKL